jgi:uroporphyrinogen decarboxylase
VDGLFPCERQAGSDPVELRWRYPGFALLGGVDKRVLIASPEAIDQELAHLSPVIAKGGYIPGVDHLVPPGTDVG